MPRPSFRLPLPLLGIAALAPAVGGLYALRPAGPPTAPAQATNLAAMLAREQAERRIAQDVIDGRRTLADAAAAFRALDEPVGPPPYVAEDLLSRGGSEEDAYRRAVILWVRSNASPGQADDLTRRLAGEVGDPLRYPGTDVPVLESAADAACNRPRTSRIPQGNPEGRAAFTEPRPAED